MNIKIHSIHFDADQKLLDFINERLRKIENFFDHITGTEVFLKLDAKGHQISDKVAEIKVSLPGKVLFSEERSKVFESSVDAAYESIIKQMKKHKDKIRR